MENYIKMYLCVRMHIENEKTKNDNIKANLKMKFHKDKFHNINIQNQS